DAADVRRQAEHLLHDDDPCDGLAGRRRAVRIQLVSVLSREPQILAHARSSCRPRGRTPRRPRQCRRAASRPTSIAVRSGSRAAEPPVVLGDGVLEPARDLHRRLGAHRCAARVARCRAQLELGPLEEVDERSILALDQVGVAAAGQPAAQRLSQLANGPQLLLGQAVGPELIAQRQKVGAGRLQPLARLLEPLRILPEAVRIRPPDVAAIRIVEAAARAETAAIERTAGVQAALLRAAPLGPALLLTALLLAALLLTAGLRVLLLAFLRLAGLTLLLAGLPLSRLSGGAE